MKNYTNIEIVYIKRLKTVQLKLGQDYINDPLEDGKPKAENPDDVHEILKSVYR